MTFDGTTNVVNYGVCESANNALPKIVTINNFDPTIPNSEFSVKFKNDHFSNFELNVNGTGAKKIRYNDERKLSSPLLAKQTYTFRYNDSDDTYDIVGSSVNPFGINIYFNSGDTVSGFSRAESAVVLGYNLNLWDATTGSVLIGCNNASRPKYGTAIGGLGNEVNSSAQYGMAIGYHCSTYDFAQLAMGKFSKRFTPAGGENLQTGTAFTIGNGTSQANDSNAFRVDYNGAAYGLKSYTSSGADYAEFIYEWNDNNENEEDRIGYFVTVKDQKLYRAASSDYIAGITSGNPSVVGNGDEDYYWKYERDEFNRLIWEDAEEEVQAFDEESGEPLVNEETGAPVMKKTGNIIPKGKIKISENYNPDNQYIERKDRKEWDYVGMLGVLPVRDDGTCLVGQYCKCNDDGMATIATPEEVTTNRFTYMVIERISSNVVKVILK